MGEFNALVSLDTNMQGEVDFNKVINWINEGKLHI